MKQRLYISEYLSEDDLSKQLKGKLFNYHDFKQINGKENSGPFYYNEDEKNKFLENYRNERNKNNNSKNINNNNKIKTSNSMQNFQKKRSVINFAVKEEKNKNLKMNNINDDNKNMDLYLRLVNKQNNINNKISKDNFLNKKNSNNHVFSTFNVNHLANINTNVIKLISQQIMEIPKPQICYFTREIKTEEDLLYSKPILLSKNEICYYKKSYIYNEQKISTPKINICYFSRVVIIPEQKCINPVLSKRYFCTKIKKNYKKHKGKKLTTKEKNSLNYKNIKENTRKSMNNNMIKGKRKSQKRTDIKYKSYQNKFYNNNNAHAFKTLNQDNIRHNLRSSNLPKGLHLNPKKLKHKTKTISPTNKKSKNYNLPHINNDQNDYSSTSSSNEREKKHNSLFRHLLNKNDNLNELLGIKKNKVQLQKKFPNGFEFSRNNNLYMPKIRDTNSISSYYKTPKTKISPNIKSSKDLIKKINEEAVLNNKNKNKGNNNILFNSYDSPSYHIMNYNHKDVENNFIKYDIHYNTNNLLYQKGQPVQLRMNSLQESNSQKNQNINMPNLKINKNQMKKIKSQFELTPLQFKNPNNRYDNLNIFENLKKNNKSITLKKIKISKGKKGEIKHFKSGYLAIKEYFNIK